MFIVFVACMAIYIYILLVIWSDFSPYDSEATYIYPLGAICQLAQSCSKASDAELQGMKAEAFW